MFQAGLRSIGSGVLLILWCWVRGIRIFKLDGSLPLGLLIGCLFSLEFGLLYVGLSMTDASRAVLYIFVSPFVTALGAHFFMPGERLTPLKWLGLILAFTAVAIVFSSGLSVPKREQIVGDLLCIAMGITWGVENVIVKVSRLRHVEVERILFYDLTISAVILTGAAWLIGEAGLFDPSLRVLASLAYAIVAISFVSYLVFTSMLRRYQAAGARLLHVPVADLRRRDVGHVAGRAPDPHHRDRPGSQRRGYRSGQSAGGIGAPDRRLPGRRGPRGPAVAGHGVETLTLR